MRRPLPRLCRTAGRRRRLIGTASGRTADGAKTAATGAPSRASARRDAASPAASSTTGSPPVHSPPRAMPTTRLTPATVAANGDAGARNTSRTDRILRDAAVLDDHEPVRERGGVDGVVRHDDGRGVGVARAARRARVRMPSAVSGSSEVSGSSSSSAAGSVARARASATRCCCPPDSSAGRRCSIPGSPTRRSHSSACARAAVAVDPARAQPERDVGARVHVGEQPRLLAEQHDAALRGRDLHAAAPRPRSLARARGPSRGAPARRSPRAASTCRRRSDPSPRRPRGARSRSATSSRNPSRSMTTDGASSAPPLTARPPRAPCAHQQQHGHRGHEQQQRQRDGGSLRHPRAVEGGVDRERHRLRDAGRVAGEQRRRAELADARGRSTGSRPR